MRGKELAAVILLSSGLAFTTCGLMFMIVHGAKAPIVFPAFVLIGIIDGATGVILTLPGLFSRSKDEPSLAARGAARERAGAAGEPATREWRMRQNLIMASGILSVLFLGVIGLLALYLHVILSWLRSSRFF